MYGSFTRCCDELTEVFGIVAPSTVERAPCARLACPSASGGAALVTWFGPVRSLKSGGGMKAQEDEEGCSKIYEV